MWGAPGTMLAALFMFESSGDERWKEVYVRNVGQLISELEKNEEHNCYVWTQDMYGRSSIYLGAVHGFAANVFAILKGRKYLDSQTLSLVESRARETLERSAKADAVYANWPAGLGGTGNLVQHCHGAPGMITCLADLAVRCGRGIRSTIGKRWRTHMESGATDKRPEPVSRHRRQWLRLSKTLSQNRRRKVAGARACIRDARHRAERAARQGVRTPPLLALDRRRRPCRVSVGLYKWRS